MAQAVRHFENGDFASAIGICQRILQADATHYQAMTLLGVLAYYAGNAEAAIQLLERSIRTYPNQPDAHNNLGEICRASGQLQRAVLHFQQALKLNPQHVGALINQGNALQDIYDYRGAIALYERVLDIAPQHAGALSNLANVYQQLYLHPEAIATFDRLLALDPSYEWAQGGRLYSRIHGCDWHGYAASVKEIRRQIMSGGRPIKVFELRPVSDAPEIELACARTFAQTMYPEGAARPAMPEVTGKIRVAYVSADFRQHPVSQLLIEVLERHDRSQFEVIGISLGPNDGSPIRQRVINACDQFFDVRQQSDEQVVALMREQSVHLAIDLMGYTTHARPAIFALRAAPLQIGYLGYSGTTGAPYMDYIIADNTVIPPELATHYSEQVLRLPEPLLPRDTSVLPAATPSRAQAGLPEQGLVFCAFNNHYKISPEVFEVWMRLLNHVEASVLWLSDASDHVKNNLRAEATRLGVAADRLVFAPRLPRLEDHLARQGLADLFLDTYPYNAHTTASDALWAGLPVITCMGQIFSSRVAGSLLQALGMQELMTSSLSDYERLALQLAGDESRRDTLRQALERNKNERHVFDAARYAANLEDLFRQALAATDREE
ncbi:tetratricopeptide repeat protein [Methylovorus menthalis]|uniref:O-linked N-acetylglucosamine transferase, SPINDLY family protein n=1 Tax=Methylovorus menthalis TaxID=1002227 RepID=UPI001E28F5E0|nr:tetratricopeptide repeat protein [Methylovorus menthalis]MCB4809711.1 tetratricopeptide repeat protein [Methylovorus menthalis]